MQKNLLRRLGLGLGLSFGAAGASLAAALRRPLPRMQGSLRLAGLGARATVLRDRWGIPHIYAEGLGDLFLAQGYVHAQDRLWQLELHRRTGHGRLAELFGPIAVDADRYLRTLGFSHVARRELALLDEHARLALESYAHGINLFVEQQRGRLPLEFTLLRAEPEPWQPLDSLVWAKVMSLNLCNNWSLEILRARIVAAVGAERADQLEPHYPDEHPLTVPAGASYSPSIGAGTLELAEQAERFGGGSPDTPQGSNAWAVAGTRSTSGKPLLASDPHLGLQLPPLWYEIHLDAPGYRVIGASLPATPGVVIGHNERIAWGVTNGMVDTQDLYLEQVHPDDPTRYRVGDGWEQAELLREEIRVRGKPQPLVEEVHRTRHGPVVSRLDAGAAQPLALRWAALEPGRLVEAVFKLNCAQDWAGFRAALQAWDSPPQNFVYADVEGHIGYALAGRVPLRAPGHDGRLPVPGWEDSYEWRGFVPAHELPYSLDPEEGLIVSANNRIVDRRCGHELHGEWYSGYRARRVGSLLKATPRHDTQSFGAIQMDLLSLPGLELARLVARLTPADPVARRARDLLARWDGVLDAARPEGAIYAATRYHLLRRAFAEVEPDLATIVGLGPFAALPANHLLTRALPQVLQQAAGQNGAAPSTLLADAFAQAIAELRSRYGDDVVRWVYGRGHRIAIRHPLGMLPALGKLLNRGPISVGGDIDTVCMGHIPRDSAHGAVLVAPSYRLICDTSDWDASSSLLPGGQSGHPGSRRYGDQIGQWRRGERHPLLWNRAQVEAAAEARLVLEPVGGH
jgi:penicillin amidase